MKQVTIKDVARRAGVHHSTVSLVLTENARISERTRVRVRKIIKELGYKHDKISMALTTRRMHKQITNLTPRLAYLTHFPDRSLFDRMIHNQLFFQGASDRARSLGYECDLVFMPMQPAPDAEFIENFKSVKYDGIILGALDPLPSMPPLDWNHYAVSKIDTQAMAQGVHSVCNDQIHAIRTAFQRLRALGYRRIGMAVGKEDERRTGNLYSAGFLFEAAALSDRERIPPLFFPNNSRAPDVMPLVKAWINRFKIDVVMSNWSYIITIVRDIGYDVPEQVACAGLGMGVPTADEAGIVQNHYLVGRKAVDSVVASLKASVLGISDLPKATLVAGSWHDGNSAPAKRAPG